MNGHNSTGNGSAVLLEIGTEEVPSRFLSQAIEDLRSIALRTFEEYRLDHQDVSVCATPRRLSLQISGVAGSQRDNIKEVFGPSRNAAFDPEGNPTKAATGFASSVGLAVSELALKQKGKGEYVVAVVREKGLDTKTVLPDVMKKIIMSLHFPKSMRWGNGSFYFVRPISWILAIYGPEKIAFDIDGLESGNQTKGHRFLAPASFQIKDISAYRHFLEANFVALDQQERRDMIKRSMVQLIDNSGLQVVADEGLLETVNYLVEYPVPVLCSFDREYLKLPKELLITVMKDHQKYFALQDASGHLANSFIVISNTNKENSATVRLGAQRVIKARFDDAKFYYIEDSSRPLAARMEDLRDVTFHARLGTLLEKTDRIASNAGFLAEKISPDLKDKAVRAARLSKTDLITGVVREFPELQGIMGKYYACNDSEDRDVCDALEEQYIPKSFGDRIPRTEAGAILSLADRIDNIASFFSIGLIPTGSEDPFALRRQAMGIVSILLEKGYAVSLQDVFEHAVKNMQKIEAPEPLMDTIMQFMNQRTEFILSSAGHNQEIIKSVLQLSFTRPLQSINARINALAAVLKEESFSDFLLAIKRVGNIMPKTPLAPFRSDLFLVEEEKNLARNHASVKTALHPLIETGNFSAAVREILTMTPAINSFFDRVLVMDKQEEIRTNRLSLLRQIWETVAPIADFSKFQS